MKTPVFFDLDGTLTDPKVGITRSIQFALQQLGIEPPTVDDLLWCIGPPLQTSFETLVGEAQVSEAVALYRQRFSEVGWLENTPYQGVASMLETLHSRQIPLYVATSKPHVFANKILDHFDLSRYFQGIFGSELDGTNTQKEDLLRHALRHTKAPSNSTMVGDRSHDIVGAKRNGMKTVGVTYGYGSYAELQEAGADRVVHQLSELAKIFS